MSEAEWDALVARTLAGESSPAEARLVRDWLRAHGVDESHIHFPGRVADLAPIPPRNVQANWAVVWNRVQPTVAPPSHPAAPARSMPWYALGGVAAGMAALALGWRVVTTRGPDQTPPVAHYATTAGQRATVTLPDGSRAALGPATTLTATRTDAGMSVTVDGAAQFTVSHSAATPFVVRTTHTVTRVLGTTFLVRQYGVDRVARVLVTEGRVSVQGMGDRSERGVLAANALAVVNDSGDVVVTPNVPAHDYAGWVTGELEFHGALARDVVADLSRAYGLDIQLTDSALGQQRVDWSVQTARYPLSQVLPELLVLLKAHAKQSSTGITIAPGRLTSRRPAVVRPSLTSETEYGR